MQDLEAQLAHDEQVEAAGAYAVQMQLAASRRVGAVTLALLALGGLAWWYTKSYWWFVGATILTTLAFHFVMQSCMRFVSRATGMPPEVQSYLSKLYKTDPSFKSRVDALLH